jgi:hypothetical protein
LPLHFLKKPQPDCNLSSSSFLAAYVGSTASSWDSLNKSGIIHPPTIFFRSKILSIVSWLRKEIDSKFGLDSSGIRCNREFYMLQWGFGKLVHVTILANG